VLALDAAGTVIEFILGQGLIVGEKEEEPLFVDVVLVVVAEEFVRLALFVVKVLGSNEIASELVLAGSNPAADMLLKTVVLRLGWNILVYNRPIINCYLKTFLYLLTFFLSLTAIR
jgi:hypothetical protein